jgi:hypothetical protein
MNSNHPTAITVVSQAYIDGAFVEPQGRELFDLFNPSTEERIGQVRLGDREDAQRAIAAARRAFPAMARTTKAERIALLERLQAAVAARVDHIRDAMMREYGASHAFASSTAARAAEAFRLAADTLRDYPLERRIGSADVRMEPVGVAALITPWNSNAGFICTKLATAIAAGCTSVVKPSEMSALQTQVVLEALHAAGLPPGVFNVVNGRVRRGGRGVREPSRRGQGVVHRQHGGGQGHPARRCGHPQARDAGAGRQVADDPAGRCGFRDGDPAGDPGRLHQQRPGLQRRHAPARAAHPPGRGAAADRAGRRAPARG